MAIQRVLLVVEILRHELRFPAVIMINLNSNRIGALFDSFMIIDCPDFSNRLIDIPSASVALGDDYIISRSKIMAYSIGIFQRAVPFQYIKDFSMLLAVW